MRKVWNKYGNVATTTIKNLGGQLVSVGSQVLIDRINNKIAGTGMQLSDPITGEGALAPDGMTTQTAGPPPDDNYIWDPVTKQYFNEQDKIIYNPWSKQYLYYDQSGQIIKVVDLENIGKPVPQTPKPGKVPVPYQRQIPDVNRPNGKLPTLNDLKRKQMLKLAGDESGEDDDVGYSPFEGSLAYKGFL